jgi:hypothetical protein
MPGLFATWQPQYAVHGIPTFPVEITGKDKKPSVRGYLNTSLGASRYFARKFSDADAFGFPCGKRSGLTVLDIDSDEQDHVDEAAERYGRSPILYRTLSGNHGMLYRYNGETRRIRLEHMVDLLGDGGYAVAPPSVAPTGWYEFLEGSLADLTRLPALKLQQSENGAQQRIIRCGMRNNELFREGLRVVRLVDDFDSLVDCLRTRNEFDCEIPLADIEVLSIARSVWEKERTGKNFVGRSLMTLMPTNAIKQFYEEKQHEALVLLNVLKAYHWEQEVFVLSRAMAESLGWHVRKFYKARKILEDKGLIKCRHRGGKGPNDPPVYCWL